MSGQNQNISPSTFRQKVSKLGDLVRWEQTLFALPIALASALWAARGWPSLASLALVLLAMVSARTAGMAANRLIDAKIDAANPRTKGRPLPDSLPSKKQKKDALEKEENDEEAML